MDEFKTMIYDGSIASSIASGSSVEIYGLGSFDISDPMYEIDMNNILLEMKEKLKKLNGELSALDVCRDIYDRYLKTPTKALKEALKSSYEEIPDHMKHYVGDMDIKDIQVRMIIYGNKEIEKWSHYMLAKQRGERLPSITIPTPIDE